MLTIRKNGGASVVSLPKAVLKALGVENGSRLTYSVSGRQLILEPVNEELTLESLFDGVEDGEYQVPEDDPDYSDITPKGKENP